MNSYISEIPVLSCNLCSNQEDEVELIDIESNSLGCGDDTIEFSDLIRETINFKLDSGFICVECQHHMTQFYLFKTRLNLNFEADQRYKIVKKLDMFLEDSNLEEDLVVLRYNQCFTVVPESRRSLMENFQGWQPQIIFERLHEPAFTNVKSELIQGIHQGIHEDNKIIIEETPEEQVGYDEIFFEDDQEYVNDINGPDILLEPSSEPLEADEASNGLKHSKSQRAWANEMTKTCYSIQQTEEGMCPIWTCSQCEKAYKSAQALRLHLLSKHLDSEENSIVPLTDEMREWIRNENRERRVVIQTADGDKFEFTCGICEYACRFSSSFRAHLIEKHIKSENSAALAPRRKTLSYHQQQWIKSQIKHEPDDCIWQCLKCELSFKTEKILRTHLIEHAGTLTTEDFRQDRVHATRPKKSKPMKFDWTCKECWFQFSTQRSFDSHMKLHRTLLGMNPFIDLHSCEECKMFFRNIDDLASHVDGHSEDQSLLVQAEGIALQKTILFKRLQVPPEENKGESICGHCGRRFDGENSCRSHLLIHHLNPLVCPKDGREFLAMQPFICHLQKVHSDILPDSLNCTHCKIPFDNIYERLAHMKLCDEKKFHCDHCDKKFSSKNYMNNHLKREMGLLSCSCTVCGKVLKAKDELKIHMRSHTREKPYKCSVCEKRYTTTSARASHMETHKDTVIQCEVCAVKFVARRHYVIHYKRYHDETYRQRKLDEQTCNLCAKQFLRKDRLREHMQKVH